MEILERQRRFFNEGHTLDIRHRKRLLKLLRSSIIDHKDDILAALKEDLGKSETEAYMCEYGLVLSEISHTISHMVRWGRKRRVCTPLANFHSSSYILREPYGNVLIMSPWNYPFLLCISPLICALAAGNTAVIKPSAYAPATSAAIKRLVEDTFTEDYVAVIEGGRDVNADLLEQKWDYIFFTGGVAVGREVMRHASEHLTPVTLELGGKSPCIVDATADVALAAKRIAWGKFINAGQTCVAPDYVLVHRSVHKEFIETMKEVISDFYGDTSSRPSGMTLIATGRHWERIRGLIPEEGDPTVRTVIGGGSDEATKYIAPTVLDGCTWDAAAMQEEIFGPVLPVIEYEDLDSEVIARVRAGEKPLALYLFTRSRAQKRKVLSEVSFGGGCVNETIMHLGNENMPFGGVGNSGMGAYHGLTGFETFSHMKSILFKSSWLNFDLLKPPYGRKLDLVRRIYK